jgi:chromosome segregation ATPase
VKLSQQIKPKVPGDCTDEENLQLGENQDSGEKSRSNVTTDGAWTLVVSANDLLHNLNTEEAMTMHLLKAEKYVRGTTDLETLFDSLSRALSSNKRSKKEEELNQEVDCSLPLIVRAENLLKYCRLHFKKLGDTLWYFNSSTETESRPLYVLVSLLKKSELDLLAELKKTRDESSYEELDEMLQKIGEELKEKMAEFYLDQDLESSINETKTDRKQESRKDENNSSSDAAKENQKVDLAKNLEKERKLKQDLARSLEKEKDDLTKNLEKERKSKQELTKSLEKEKEAKDDLAKNLEKERKLKQDLAKKLGKEQKHNSELVASLEAANEENSRLKDSLKSEGRAKQELQVTLREKEREKKELIEMIEKKEKESVEQNWTKNVPKTGYKASGEKTRITSFFLIASLTNETTFALLMEICTTD